MKSISLPWNRMSYRLSGFQKLHKKGKKTVSFLVCLLVPYHPHPHCHFLKLNINRFNLLRMLGFMYNVVPGCAAPVLQDFCYSLTPLDIPYCYDSPPIPGLSPTFLLASSTKQPCSSSPTEKIKPEAGKSGG